MKHTEAITKLPQYIDDDLSDEEYLKVEVHLEGCEACQNKIDKLLAEESQISRYTDAEILRLLRAGYTLSDDRERELIQHFQDVIADFWQPSFADALPLAADEGKKRKQLEEIKRQLGPEFAEKRLRISLKEETTYWGRFEIHDIHSAYLVFEEDRQETFDFDGIQIEFYNQDAPEKTLTERIEEDSVLLDFGKLFLSIRDYKRVGFRLSISGEEIEGGFAEM